MNPYLGKGRFYNVQARQLGTISEALLEQRPLEVIIRTDLKKTTEEKLAPWAGRLPEGFDHTPHIWYADPADGELAWFPRAREANIRYPPLNTGFFGVELPNDVVLQCERCNWCCNRFFKPIGHRDNLKLGERMVRHMSYLCCSVRGMGECVDAGQVDDQVYDPEAPTHTWKQLNKRLIECRQASFASLHNIIRLALVIPAPCIAAQFMNEDESYDAAEIVSIYRGYRVCWHQALLHPCTGSVAELLLSGPIWGDLSTDFTLVQADFIDGKALERVYGLDRNSISCLLRWPKQWDKFMDLLNSYAGLRYSMVPSKLAEANRAVGLVAAGLKRLLEAETDLMIRRNMVALDTFKAREKQLQWLFLELDSAILHEVRPDRIAPAQ